MGATFDENFVLMMNLLLKLGMITKNLIRDKNVKNEILTDKLDDKEKLRLKNSEKSSGVSDV